MSERERIVVKYGSSSCTNENGINQGNLEHYASQIAEQQHRYNRDVVAVVSGAVAVAKSTLLPQAENAMFSEQMLATYGSPSFMKGWQEALKVHGVIGGELLVTHHEIDDRQERGMLVETIEDHLAAGWVSLINENDGLSDEEIAKLSYGADNDGLALHIAKVIGAKHLCFMTDKDGLLDQHEALVNAISFDNLDWARNLAGDPGNQGSGGMRSKLDAGWEANTWQPRIIPHIAFARSNLEDVITGRVGTNFVLPQAA
jgi:glutamate 5-kinase